MDAIISTWSDGKCFARISQDLCVHIRILSKVLASQQIERVTIYTFESKSIYRFLLRLRMRPVQMDPQVLMHLAAEIQLAQCAKHPAKFRSVS